MKCAPAIASDIAKAMTLTHRAVTKQNTHFSTVTLRGILRLGMPLAHGQVKRRALSYLCH